MRLPARWLLVAVLVASGAPGAAGAPSPVELIGADSFSLLADSSGAALSLQDSRLAVGTRAIPAEYLKERRADQMLELVPSGEDGVFSLGVAGTGRVLEVRESGGETVVVLALSAAAPAQQWRLETDGPGRFRLASATGRGVLTETGGLRPAVSVAPFAGLPAQRWRILLHPRLLAELGAEARARGAEGGLEGRYPTLARQLVVNREPSLDHEQAARRLEEYLSTGGGEIDKGMSIVLLERLYALAPEEPNGALTLLLWLLSQGAYLRGDTISLALALANASLYASGDEAVRARIREDLLDHFELYRATLDWQTGWVVAYRLADAPLLAKVLWCYRANQVEQNGAALTLEEYQTFVDRVPVLREIQSLLRARAVDEATSLRGVVRNIDTVFQASYRYAHFMAMIRQWYSPDAPLPEDATDAELYAYLTRPEVAKLLPDWVHDVLEDYRNGTYYVEVLGRRRDPQARMWLNYQWELYGETGFFRGDCGTEAEVTMAYWKAAGIVALAFYHTGTDIGHAYAMYYDPFTSRLTCLQDLSAMTLTYDPATTVTLHPMPLRIHDHLPLLRPRPATDVASYTRFIARGVDEELLERLYLDRGAWSSGEIFTAASCPESLPDADRDGLRDEDEARLGTSAEDADTDHDGFADAWEVERGFDARDPTSPARSDFGKLLVGHVVRVSSANTGTVLDPEAVPPESGPAAGESGLYRIVRSEEAQYHFVVAVDSGLCVTALERGSVRLTPLAGSRAQKWKLLFRDRGTFVIQSRADGNILALVNGQQLQVRNPRGTRDEIWVIR